MVVRGRIAAFFLSTAIVCVNRSLDPEGRHF